MENKEWESFSQYLKSKGVVKIGRNVLGVITNLVRESGCSLGYNEIELMWETWQGKSQITPEGFVLMPIKPTETMVMAVAKEHEGEAFLPYSIYDAYVKQAMIEAQEQSHD